MTDPSEARCQHCPCRADERSFMCEDCMGQADAELDALRDAQRDLRIIIEARQISRQGALNTLKYVMDRRANHAA